MSYEKLINDLFDPIVKYTQENVKNVFMRDRVIIKIQESLFWLQKALEDEKRDKKVEIEKP